MPVPSLHVARAGGDNVSLLVAAGIGFTGGTPGDATAEPSAIRAKLGDSTCHFQQQGRQLTRMRNVGQVRTGYLA